MNPRTFSLLRGWSHGFTRNHQGGRLLVRPGPGQQERCDPEPGADPGRGNGPALRRGDEVQIGNASVFEFP